MNDLTLNQLFLVVGDIAVATGILALIPYLYIKGRISLALLLAGGAGFLIGATWEFSFLALGDSFLAPVFNNPLKGWPTPFLHSIWDAGLFIAGAGSCYLLLGDQDRFTKFNPKELGIIWGWGILQEFIIELVGNGNFWRYVPQRGNPTYLTIGDTSYTVVPQLVWIVAPVVFYIVLLALTKRYGGRYCR